jgi:DNA-binding response OmpR family regulator
METRGSGIVLIVASVLIIEDDQRIRESLARRLSERGHDIETAARAMAGVERAVSGRFDVVVLDLGLPDVDGSEALRMIRAVSDVPVVIATARDDEAEIVKILDAGADGYIVKPYSAEHLEARLRAVLRRSVSAEAVSTLSAGGLAVDLDAHEASLDGVGLDLTAREFELLAYLVAQQGRMVSKRELLAEVWHQPYGGADKTVDVHLSWLRKKLGETAAEPRYIHTRRGVGVRLVVPDP